jgi:hypothetical protein
VAERVPDTRDALVLKSIEYVTGKSEFAAAILIARSEGFTYEDIARITGLPEHSIRALVRPNP